MTSQTKRHDVVTTNSGHSSPPLLAGQPKGPHIMQRNGQWPSAILSSGKPFPYAVSFNTVQENIAFAELHSLVTKTKANAESKARS